MNHILYSGACLLCCSIPCHHTCSLVCIFLFWSIRCILLQLVLLFASYYLMLLNWCIYILHFCQSRFKSCTAYELTSILPKLLILLLHSPTTVDSIFIFCHIGKTNFGENKIVWNWRQMDEDTWQIENMVLGIGNTNYYSSKCRCFWIIPNTSPEMW